MIEGNDGRIYFTYGKGAQYALFHGERNVATLIIDECLYNAEKKREEYEVSRAYSGIVEQSMLPYAQEEFEYLLNAGNGEEIEAGEAVEYPLMEEEVTSFFQTKKAYREREFRNAEQTMRKIPEYVQCVKAQEEIQKLLSAQISSVNNSEDVRKADELSARYAMICKKRIELLNANGIDPKRYDKRPVCLKCNDYGIASDGICTCAQARKKEIKDWNAAQRLAKKLSINWVDFAEKSEVDQAKDRITEERAKLTEGAKES